MSDFIKKIKEPKHIKDFYNSKCSECDSFSLMVNTKDKNSVIYKKCGNVMKIQVDKN